MQPATRRSSFTATKSPATSTKRWDFTRVGARHSISWWSSPANFSRVLARLMARDSTARSSRRRTGKARRFARLAMRFWPGVRLRRRWWRAFRRATPVVQLGVCAVLVVALSLAANWIYQVIRKPSELFFPVSATLNKTPPETWRQYAPLFRKHATNVMTPELLAAIAQVECAANPVARTYWRWSWTTRQPSEVYRPASSAVGMYQITDGTFAEARHYCIHGHVLVREGAWNDWRACWFNALYWRVVRSDAVELTSAYLDLKVTALLGRFGVTRATSAQQHQLAAAVHLC